jgi:two-component system response regulator AtoC
MSDSIIIIDDEQDFLESVNRGLITSGFKKLTLETNPYKAAALFKEGNIFSLALIDVSMEGLDGLELLEVIKTTSPSTECIMVTALNEAKVAVECLRKGAYDYLVKPITRDELVSAVKRVLERKRLLDILEFGKRSTPPKLEHEEAFSPIVTASMKVRRLLKEAELHAASDVPILVTGESGTGKELLARAIHLASPRARFNFTAINMAAPSGTLFDAEFYGHTKGAFTGAEVARIGYLEQTHKGTLFLDEIGNLPFELQGKLLRVLQDGEYLKLGSSTVHKADVRLIAATNADLQRLMAKGMFRKDLYYRLRGAWLNLPPLRERQEDIPLLIDDFLRELTGESGKIEIEDEAIALLMDYDYPGNVRELKSVITSAVNLARGGPITSKLLPGYLRRRKSTSLRDFNLRDGSTSSLPIAPLREVEKTFILRIYEKTNKNKMKTARILGIGLNTLRRKLKSYGVE